MTNRSKAEVLKYFASFDSPEYAKAGAIPVEELILEPGELTFPVSMLDQLRKLGLVVEVSNGKVVLRNRFIVTEKGIAITPEQAKMLLHLEKPLLNFKIHVECWWKDGDFQIL